MPLGTTAQQLIEVAAVAAQHYGLDANILIAQLNYESGFNPAIVGDGGQAVGVGQFHPATWTGVIQQHPELRQRFGLTGNPSERLNGEANIWAAAAHMADNLAASGGDYAAALAIYNGGPNGPNIAAAQNYAQHVLGAAGMTDGNGDYGAPPSSGGGAGPYSGIFDLPDIAAEIFLASLDAAVTEAQQKGELAKARELELLREQIASRADERGHINARDLAELSADLQIRVEEAREAGNRETQILLKEMQAEIDKAADERGYEHDKWLLAKEQAFTAAEAEKQRTFTGEQAALERENREKLSGIQELGALRRQIIDVKQRASESLANIARVDPLRAALRMQGRTPRGTTPGDVARSQLSRFAEQPVPFAPPDASARDIRRTIAGASGGTQLGGTGQVLGFPGGGVVDMVQTRLGGPEIKPDHPTPDTGGNVGVGILVGDGEGVRPNVTEVVHITDNGFEVIPLVARAQGGLTVDRPRLGTRGLAAPGPRRPRPQISPVQRLQQRIQPEPRRLPTPAAAPIGRQQALLNRQIRQGGIGVTQQGAAEPAATTAIQPLAAGIPELNIAEFPTGPQDAFGETASQVATQSGLDLGSAAQIGEIMSALGRFFPTNPASAAAAIASLAQSFGLLEAWQPVVDLLEAFSAGFIDEQGVNTAITQYVETGVAPNIPGAPPPEPARGFPEPLPPNTPQFVIDALSNWPNLSSRGAAALVTQDPSLQPLANIILRLVAGTLTPEQAAAEIVDFLIEWTAGLPPAEEEPPPGEEPPPTFGEVPVFNLPPEADPQETVNFINALINRFPNWTIQDANLALTLGLGQIATAILDVLDGLLDPAAVRDALQNFAGTIDVSGVDIPALRSALEQIFAELGIPIEEATSRGAQGSPYFGYADVFGGPNSSQFFDIFGVAPEFVRDAYTGQIFAIQNGQLIPLTGTSSPDQQAFLDQYGLNPADIVAVPSEDLGSFGQLPAGFAAGAEFGGLTAPQYDAVKKILEQWQNGVDPTIMDAQRMIQLGIPGAHAIITRWLSGLLGRTQAFAMLRGILEEPQMNLNPGVTPDILSVNEPATPFPTLSAPLVEPTTGLILPAIRKIASLWPRLGSATQDLLVQAYSLATEIPPERIERSLNRELDFFTPEGSFSPAQVAAFG